MPIVNDNVEAPVAGVQAPDIVQATQPNVVATTVRSAIVDSRYTSLANLITYVEGSPWVVDWFSGVVDRDDELSQNQPNQHPVYQQYVRVKDLEIRVQETLSESTGEGNEITVTGSSTTYPHFIPNVGDTFLADLGDGREAVFGITEVTRKSIFEQTCYGITYTLLDVGVGTAARRADLETKTVATHVFKKNFLQQGINPILIESSALNYDQLLKYQHVVLRNYLVEFFSPEVRTLLVPHATARIYDHYLVAFLLKIVDTTDHPLVKQIRTLNVSGAESMEVYTLWDLLAETDLTMLPLLQKEMWRVPVSCFTKQPTLGSIRYTNATDAVYPFELVPGSHLHVQVGGELLNVIPTTPIVYPALSNFEIADSSNSNVMIRPPMIHAVRADNNYVLSTQFYTDATSGQSALELLLKRALANESIDPAHVIELCNKVNSWEALDRFYLVPVLLVLLKASIYRL